MDPDLNFDIAKKRRIHGGVIGIDNSSLDKYFKSYITLRLHAILHDGSGFVLENSEKRQGYLYILSLPLTNEYIDLVTGIVFCLYVKF